MEADNKSSGMSHADDLQHRVSSLPVLLVQGERFRKCQQSPLHNVSDSVPVRDPACVFLQSSLKILLGFSFLTLRKQSLNEIVSVCLTARTEYKHACSYNGDLQNLYPRQDTGVARIVVCKICILDNTQG